MRHPVQWESLHWYFDVRGVAYIKVKNVERPLTNWNTHSSPVYLLQSQKKLESIKCCEVCVNCTVGKQSAIKAQPHE